ncbi:MAG: sigma factor-like helix-turn-helix DNA-binding protein, partial [Planctomycetota bacterium]
PGPGAAENDDFQLVFGECLKKLTDSLRFAFCLREMEGLELQEICEILGVSETNLSTQLYRARMQLRCCLEKNWISR